jgi:hypothetical protein
MARTTNLDIDKRRDEITAMMVEGRPTRTIVATIQHSYGVSRSTVEKDITMAYDALKQYTKRNIEDIVAVHVNRYESVYQRACEAYDFRSAIAALQAIEKLLRMHVDQPLVAIQNNTMSFDGMSTQEIIENIKILKSKQDENSN